jgi:hypothetical protein
MTSPVTIARFLTPLEGELARMRLAQEGIVCALGSADLLTWLWHFSFAFRGVSLEVRPIDAIRAIEILTIPQKLSTERETTHDCVHCGETLPGDWEVCWKCGTDLAGGRDELFFIELIRPTRALQYLSGTDYPGFLILAIVFALVIHPPFLVVAALTLFMYPFAKQVPAEQIACEPETYAALPWKPYMAFPGNELCRQGLASAMFGLGWLPPLTFYSIWLLIVSHTMSVDAKGRLWRKAAWAMNFITLAPIVFALAVLVDIEYDNSLSGSLGVLLRNLFYTSAGFDQL